MHVLQQRVLCCVSDVAKFRILTFTLLFKKRRAGIAAYLAQVFHKETEQKRAVLAATYR